MGLEPGSLTVYDCEARCVRWGVGRWGICMTHELESLNGSSEGKGIDCGVRARGGGGGATRRETGNDESRRVLEGGRDTGTVRQAALASPGGILSIGEASITTPACDE